MNNIKTPTTTSPSSDSVGFPKVGLFDSGWGGLSVLAPLATLLSETEIIYLADHDRFPYGDQSLSQVQQRAHQLTEYLISAGAGVIVLACHTASAAALTELRVSFPHTRFVGIEPAIKPAAVSTHNLMVGVLATRATFQGKLFASVVQRFGNGVGVVARACSGWAELVEEGQIKGSAVRDDIGRHLIPVLTHGVDTLVLGCTHYSFLESTIAEVAGPEVRIVDPASAVARQAHHVYRQLIGGEGREIGSSGPERPTDLGDLSFPIEEEVSIDHVRLLTTGSDSAAAEIVHRLVGWDTSPEIVTV